MTRVDLLTEHCAFREVTNIKTEEGKFSIQDCVLEAAILKRP